jgi:hypothetical protein
MHYRATTMTRNDSFECLIKQRNILKICFEGEWRTKARPRQGASGEALANGPKAVVVIEGHGPNNKAACQDLRLRMGPAGANRAGELVTWSSA